jgi:hypothetical protein
MGLPVRQNLTFIKGKTFTRVIRWEEEPFIYKAITAISRTAPARITATGHGVPDGWRVAVVSVQGMRQINAENNPPAEDEFNRATVIDANTVDINAINAAEFSAYASGGYLQFYTPKDLDDCVARMTVKDRHGGTELLVLTSGAGEIALDNTEKTITVTVAADVTEAIDWARGVYDLEVEDGDGVVTALYFGTINVKDEVTT